MKDGTDRPLVLVTGAAGWLVASVYLAAGGDADGPAQSDMVTGLVLLMLAIVRTRAIELPASWRAAGHVATSPPTTNRRPPPSSARG